MARLRLLVKRFCCVSLLIGIVILLVLFQALQLPSGASNYDSPATDSDLLRLSSNHRGDDDLPSPPKYISPVPSVCHEPLSLCLEGLLLSPRKKTALTRVDELAIPAILHLIILDDEMEEVRGRLAKISDLIQAWHQTHSNWIYVLWMKSDVRRLVKVFFSRYSELLMRLGSKAELTFLARVLILQKYGGVVVNESLRPKRNLDSLRWLPAVFISKTEDASIDSGLLMAAKGHPFVQFCAVKTLHNPTYASVGWTELMRQYSIAFPLTDRPDHSVLLAKLVSSSTEASHDWTAAERNSSISQLTKLPRIIRFCENALKSPRKANASASTVRPMRCSDLLTVRDFLQGSERFLQTQLPPTSDERVLKNSLLRVLTVDRLTEMYPLLNVGLQRAWRYFP